MGPPGTLQVWSRLKKKVLTTEDQHKGAGLVAVLLETYNADGKKKSSLLTKQSIKKRNVAL